ncbi:MAG: Do family serine endopeptidase [bacterium]|nr:Do family serine endopeptidase [bacterium]
MSTTMKNAFGIAAAILLLLGVNATTDFSKVDLPFYDTEVVPAESKPVATLKDFNDAIVDIAEKTNPAVVTVNTEKTQEVRVVNPFSFFGNPWGQPEGETRERVQRGLGSGVIVSEDGYILTNNHVIDDTDEIKITLFNGDEVTAELIGADPQTDIAVLKINGKNLPAIELGNSDDAKVGSFVLAIGSPLSNDLAHTVSFGIVSARGRSLNNLTLFGDYIQTDAAINPGNSGGALIDLNGELVGINSAIASRSGGNDGIGFAIPINLAKRIMDDLIDDGEVSRGYLGMNFGGEVDQTMALAMGLDNARGIIVGEVVEDGPSDKAGLRESDIIISLNNEPVRDWDAFRTKIASYKPGDTVKLGIIRGDDEMELSIELGERPNELAAVNTESARDINERLGFNVSELTNDLKRQLNLGNDTEGVVVNSIEESSNAFERGLRRGDIITAVKRNRVESPSEFFNEIQRSVDDGDKAILLTIERNNVKQFIAFEL